MSKESKIAIKYGMGATLIAIIVIALQYVIITIGTNLMELGAYVPVILIFLSMIVIPLIGQNIIIKENIKKDENIKVSKILGDMTVINIILIFFCEIFVMYKLRIIPNYETCLLIKDGKTFLITEEIKDIIGNKQTNLFLNNYIVMIKAFIISVIYTTILMITFVRNKINKIMEIEKEKRAKQINSAIIITMVAVIIGTVGFISLDIVKKHMEQTAVIKGEIVLEKDLSNQEIENIENIIKDNDKIISYEHKTKEDAYELMRNIVDEGLLDKYDDVFPEIYTITFLNKDSEEIEKEVQEIEGIKNFRKENFIK